MESGLCPANVSFGSCQSPFSALFEKAPQRYDFSFKEKNPPGFFLIFFSCSGLGGAEADAFASLIGGGHVAAVFLAANGIDATEVERFAGPDAQLHGRWESFFGQVIEAGFQFKNPLVEVSAGRVNGFVERAGVIQHEVQNLSDGKGNAPGAGASEGAV